MKFSVTVEGPDGQSQSIGTIDVTEAVYNDDDALIAVLASAGYVDRDESLDVIEDTDNQVDIFEYETGTHLVSLVLVQ